MSAAELAKYTLQLAQVDASLAAEPDNAELKQIREDLVQVVELTRSLVKLNAAGASGTSSSSAGAAGSASASSESRWKVGDQCETTTGEARTVMTAEIIEISRDGKTVQLKFQKTSATELVPIDKIRPVNLKRKATEDQQKKQARWRKIEEKRDEEDKANATQRSSWSAFAQKKAKSIPGISHKSIFASPDTLEGRVGVVGSGKGATPLAQRKRHEFREEEGEAPTRAE